MLNKNRLYEDYKYELNNYTLQNVINYCSYGFFTISAFLSDLSFEENLERDENLRADLRMYKLEVIEQKGRYRYVETGEIQDELSYFVPYNDIYTYDEFMDIAIKLLKKYEQESVLIYDQNDSAIYGLYARGSLDIFKDGVNVLSPEDISDVCSEILRGFNKGTRYELNYDYFYENVGFRSWKKQGVSYSMYRWNKNGYLLV